MTAEDPVRIRAMIEEDEGDIARLAREGFEESHPFDWERNARGLAEGARKGTVSVLVALAGETLVGYVNLRPWLEGGWIDQVAVGREWRRRGVASRLAEAAAAVARERGMRHVGVMVAEGDSGAAGFWRKSGWKPVGPVEGALGEKGNGLLLNRRL